MQLYIQGNKKDNWNQLVIESGGSFLQCFEWGEFQKKLSKKVWRLQVREGESALTQALVIKRALPLKFKNYFYIPYGPCFRQGLSVSEQQEALGLILQELQGLAKKEKAVFLRLEPSQSQCYEVSPHNIALARLQPQKTLILDITKPEREIFQGFSKATRYSIRMAQKKGVSCELKNEYVPEFYQLLRKTSARGRFKPHPEAHYQAFFHVVSEGFKAKMCLAKHQEKIIAGSILVLFGNRATYLHAASDKKAGSLQGPSFLVHEQIKLAKQMGCEVYDFWGIDEARWPGVTHFKKSFGGEEVEHPQGKDIIFQKSWYKLYKAARNLKG